jgi:hypothetical protein
VLEFSSDCHPYTSSRIWLMGDRKLHNGGRGDVSSAWVHTELGMALQCLNLWHNDGHMTGGGRGDGEDALCQPYVIVSSRAC